MPRPVADDCRRIEARQVPPPGGRTGLRWGNIAAATLAREGEVVELHYRWRGDPGAPWHETRQTLKLVYLERHFGGWQTLFACPTCQRRALKFYHPAGEAGFMCRHCGRLVPRSQSESSWQRALRRAAKLRRYCGGDGDVSTPFPPRPRGMKQRTYRMLKAEAERLEALPAEAWLTSGTANIRLGIRRLPGRQSWWPGRDAGSRSGPGR